MLPVENAVETALTVLKSSTTDTFYRQNAWDLIRTFLVASISLDDDQQKMKSLFFNSAYATHSLLFVLQKYKLSL